MTFFHKKKATDAGSTESPSVCAVCGVRVGSVRLHTLAASNTDGVHPAAMWLCTVCAERARKSPEDN